MCISFLLKKSCTHFRIRADCSQHIYKLIFRNLCMKLTLLKGFCIEKCALVFQVGIIGGSGLTNPDILKDKTDKFVDTPYGKVIFMYATVFKYSSYFKNSTNKFYKIRPFNR